MDEVAENLLKALLGGIHLLRALSTQLQSLLHWNQHRVAIREAAELEDAFGIASLAKSHTRVVLVHLNAQV